MSLELLPRLVAAFLTLAILLTSLPAPAPAHAQPTPTAAPPAARRLVALAPLASLSDGKSDFAAVQSLVATGIAQVTGFSVVPDREQRATLKRAKRKELESCERDGACLAEFGKLLGAQIVITGEVGEVGGGLVAYLVAFDVATGRELGTTTAVLSGDAAARAREAKAAAYRLLAPAAYLGTLALAIDVQGAVVYIDGKVAGRSPAPAIRTSVGTHALRVTHEKYRDYVRFVDIRFDETTPLSVNLREYPIIANDMIERQRGANPPTGPTAPLPWYRQWYFVAGAGSALLITTIITTAILASGVDADRELTVEPPQ